MEKLKFSIGIKAPKEKVWNILWNDETYRKWTSVFSEGSYAVTDWKEGSKVLFLGGEGNGMYSVISKAKPNEFMSFKHLGVIKNSIEQPLDEESKKWSGALENYSLEEKNGLTELKVEMDMAEDHKSYFNETFPKALQKVKELSEN